MHRLDRSRAATQPLLKLHIPLVLPDVLVRTSVSTHTPKWTPSKGWLLPDVVGRRITAIRSQISGPGEIVSINSNHLRTQPLAGNPHGWRRREMQRHLPQPSPICLPESEHEYHCGPRERRVPPDELSRE